ncbi:MAG: GNAT family N-acetyltransferase [Proteobacteria bacterium]|nr:GNAT family N-acetyltransferase [Pseudomonadota bacterium]
MNDQRKHILIDVPMPIVTPRLVLRPPQAGDGAALTEAKAETWDDLRRWMAWTDAGQDAEMDEVYVREQQAKFILREDMTIIGIEKETGRPVIWLGLHRFDWDLRRFEIGYWVRKSAQGKGYATEGTNALLRYAFNALQAQRVEITHAEGNDKSRRVIEKLGFTFEALQRKAHRLPDGKTGDYRRYVRFDADDLPLLDVSWGPP